MSGNLFMGFVWKQTDKRQQEQSQPHVHLVTSLVGHQAEGRLIFFVDHHWPRLQAICKAKYVAGSYVIGQSVMLCPVCGYVVPCYVPKLELSKIRDDQNHDLLVSFLRHGALRIQKHHQRAPFIWSVRARWMAGSLSTTGMHPMRQHLIWNIRYLLSKRSWNFHSSNQYELF